MLRAFALMVGLLLAATVPARADLSISLAPLAGNPTDPRMGDRLKFHSTIANTGATSVEGLTAWISLLRTDPGHEQPMDLEDWSAHKAISAASLKPGQSLEVDWPMRLIQAGTYRVVICAVSRGSTALLTSPFADFQVREKPVVASNRVLPVALGAPLLIGIFLLDRWRRGR